MEGNWAERRGCTGASRGREGFSMIEMMIVLLIVGILAMIAPPAYFEAARKAKFTEVVNATRTYRLGVEECFEQSRDLDLCDSGSNGVPLVATYGAVASVGATDGIVTSVGASGTHPDLLGKTFVLTPVPEANGSLRCIVGGTGKDAGWVR
jgi:type IV pilus assembly protein PilA